jgi:hypothetical protein
MVLHWLDTAPAVEFANSTSAEIRKLIPPSEHQATRKEIGKRMKKLERVVLSARTFSASNKLNFYKKAKFANTLRWNLKEAGYSADFVREVVGLVVVNL